MLLSERSEHITLGRSVQWIMDRSAEHSTPGGGIAQHVQDPFLAFSLHLQAGDGSPIGGIHGLKRQNVMLPSRKWVRQLTL